MVFVSIDVALILTFMLFLFVWGCYLLASWALKGKASCLIFITCMKLRVNVLPAS